MKKNLRIGLFLLSLVTLAVLIFSFFNNSPSNEEELSDEINLQRGENQIETITIDKNTPEKIIMNEDQEEAIDENKNAILENIRKNRELKADPCDGIQCPLGSICNEGACELLVYNEPSGDCGNRIVDEGEVCDSGTLCTDTCECPAGLIGCEGGCAEPGYCMPKRCGNYVVNEAEECDGGDLCTQYCECPDGLIGCEGGCAEAGYCT